MPIKAVKCLVASDTHSSHRKPVTRKPVTPPDNGSDALDADPQPKESSDPQWAGLRLCVASAFANNSDNDTPSHLGVAVSGGGDSMALLLLLSEWARAENVKLSAVTVDHGLRPEAAEEARFVAQTCDALNVGHTTLTWGGWRGEGNLQDSARRARYRLMADWARREGIDAIALGHTADDQAETFFMRLARASGIDGLTGMQRRRVSDGITWVRPLLTQERSELRQFLRAQGQSWIDDPSNEDETYERVKARKAMAALADLDIDAHVVGRVMDHLADVRAALDVATHAHARTCMTEDHGDLVFDRRTFAEGAPEVNRRLVSHALRWISSAEYGPRGTKLQAFLSAMLHGKDATLHGVRLSSGAEKIRLSREFGAVADCVAAVGEVWDGRWLVECNKKQGFTVRALGDDGLLQLGERTPEGLPRESLKASPAVFDGPTLVCAPLAEIRSGAPNQSSIATARLIHPRDHVFTSLLSH